MARMHLPGWINRFVRWLFGAPFGNLPSKFGDTVPPELRVFETGAEAARHAAEREPAPRSTRHQRSGPARYDERLERQ